MEDKQPNDASSTKNPSENSTNSKTVDEGATESLVIEVDLSVYQLDMQKGEKGIKRNGNYINWKRYMKKIYRNSGEAYINYRGKPVAAKQVITPLCNCQKNCETRLTTEEKEKILSEFYGMADKDLQDGHLNSLIIVKPVKKRRKLNDVEESSANTKNAKKIRMFSCAYKIKTESKDFHICKTAFCNLFVIDKSRIDLIAQKCANERADLINETPQKHKLRSNKIPEEVLSKIREHIRSFPYKYSHYENNGIRDLQVKTMYMMYLKENYPISYNLLSKGMQAYPEVTYDYYYKCVSTFNSSFEYPMDNISSSDDVTENSDESTNVKQ